MQSPEYKKAMEDLSMFVQIGKNEHDDAPDSLAMAIHMAFFSFSVLEVKKRRF